MRQLIVQVPHGHGQEVLEIAQAHQGMNLARLEAAGCDGAVDLTLIHISNHRVEGLLEELQRLPELHITLIPRGVIALRPPAEEAPDQVTDVEPRSPIEVFLAGLQSIGSWKGFVGYAAAAGVVVWIGLFTNSIFLLVGAMLIAPFAAPAMNAAMATARGDVGLLRRSLIRYFAALLVTIAVAGVLSLILRQKVATSQMIATSEISIVAVLLPLVAGSAGALNLVQSQRTSLVSGAAVGVLVAASLAPPAGLIGMASVMGRWDMALSGLFLLLLQLFGINLAGALVFRAYGLSARGARYSRGKRGIFPVVLAITVLGLAGLLFWQISDPPNLQRASRAQRAVSDIQTAVDESGLAQLVEANTRFTRQNVQGQNTLLAVVYVMRRSEVADSSEEIQAELTGRIQARLLEEFNVTPLVEVTVLEDPRR